MPDKTLEERIEIFENEIESLDPKEDREEIRTATEELEKLNKLKDNRTTKYQYRLVIRGNFGQYWEDMCDYDAKTERKLAFADLKEYRASGQGDYKLITRRVPNE